MFNLSALFHKKRAEQEMDDELRFHLEKQIEQNIAGGMSAEEARYAAFKTFGNVGAIKEECRDTWGVRFLNELVQDVRYGLRQLRRNPGFTIVAVLTLALGIGANTAIFSVVNAALIHPLPFREAGRLVTQWGNVPEIGYSGPLWICARDYAGWRDQNHVFQQIGAYGDWTTNLTGAGEPVRLMGAQVTASLFPELGVNPSLGRGFLPGENEPGHTNEVILSGHLWSARFHSDPAVVGKSIRLGDESYTVVGVMPAGFGFPNQSEFWTPLPLTQDCSNTTLLVVGRLKPGVTLGQAQADISVISARLGQGRSGGPNHITIVPLARAMGTNLRPVLLVLMAAVGLVLLIACANVANLLLARAAGRQHEIAIRGALGASRRRIIHQLLTESVLLALSGGALGVALAVLSHRILASSIALLPQNMGSPSVMARIASVGVDSWALAFTLIISLFTGIIFGLAPALQASKPDLNETLKEVGRTSSSGKGRARVQSVLVAGEIAISLVLLIGAGLLIRSLVSLTRVDPGFDPQNVLTMNVSLPMPRYQTKTQMVAFNQQALQRLGALPGVRAAGEVFGLPLSGARIRGDVSIEGQPAPPPNVLPSKMVVAGHYFRALRIPILEGRTFNSGDGGSSTPVVIVSASMARRFWPGESAIGRRLKPGFPDDSWCTVVGVVGDVKMWGLDEKSSLAIYLPYVQAPSPFLMHDLTFVVGTRTNPAGLIPSARHAIARADSNLPVFNIATMEQRVYRSISEPRFNAFLLGIFAAVALLLASIGIYGAMSYAVGRRTHEVGIRMALGAEKAEVLRMVLGQGLKLTLAGVVIGIAGAFMLTRLLSSFLFGVKPTDPLTFILVSLISIVVALVACYIPARRAARVDPMVALRYE